MKRTLPTVCTVIILTAAAPPARADALDDAVKALDAAYAKLSTYSCKMCIDVDNEIMPGNRYKSTTTGTSEWMRSGKKVLFRAEFQDATTQTEAGKESKSEARLLTVCDGDLLYALRENLAGPQKGQKMASKMRAMADTNGLKEMRQYGIVKLLPDEKVDGHECYVIETRAKGPDGTPVEGSRTVSHFRRDLGVMVKSVGFTGGKQTATTVTSDVKVGGSISSDRFQFKAPPGVEVMDMTKQQDAAASAPAKDAKADAPKEPAPKKAEQPKKEEKEKDKSKLPKLPKLPRLP